MAEQRRRRLPSDGRPPPAHLLKSELRGVTALPPPLPPCFCCCCCCCFFCCRLDSCCPSVGASACAAAAVSGRRSHVRPTPLSKHPGLAVLCDGSLQLEEERFQHRSDIALIRRRCLRLLGWRPMRAGGISSAHLMALSMTRSPSVSDPLCLTGCRKLPIICEVQAANQACRARLSRMCKTNRRPPQCRWRYDGQVS